MITLELVPLIESSGFIPDAPGADAVLVGAGEGTLEAALLQPGAVEMPAADAPRDGLLFDLFVDARSGYRAEGAERSAHDILASTSWRGWLIQDDSGSSPDAEARGMKDAPLRAAFDDIDGDGEEDEPITVTGRRPTNVGTGEDTGGAGGGGDYPGTPGGGGGGSVPPNQQTEDADDTPCVDEVPANVDKEHLNDLAKFMGRVLAGKQDATGHDWGAFIYRAPNGQLYQSEPFTGGHADSMHDAIGHVPSGAVIVGYLHTHPLDNDSDQRNLSLDDRRFINNIIESGRADTNMLAYVVTKDLDLGRSDEYSTFVYDKSKRNATSPGCDL